MKVSVTLSTLVASFLYYLYLRRERRENGVVVIPSFPIFGNFLEFVTNKHFIKLNKLKYGEVFKYSWFSHEMYSLASAEGARWIFKNDGKHLHSSWPQHWVKLLGKYSLLNLNGEEHKKTRTMMGVLFTPRSLKQYFQSISHLSKVSLGGTVKASAGRPVEVYDIAKKYTFDIAARLFLGYDEENPRGKELLENFYVWLSGISSAPINLPFTTFGKAMAARSKILEILQYEIDERRKKGASPNNNDFEPVNFLSQILEKSELNDDEIKDEILVLLLSGHDTSATTASTMTNILGTRQDIKEKVVKEFYDNFQDTSNLDYDTLLSMPYLDALVKETLRLYPPVLGGIRVATENLEYKGYTIPKGSNISYNIPYFHNNAEYYENSEEFNPDRFLSETDDTTFIPFGSGPRVCLGQNLAKLELKIYALVMSIDYDIEILSSYAVNMPIHGIRPIAKLTPVSK